MIAPSRHGNQSVAARSTARPRSGQPRRSRTRSPRRRGVLLVIVLAILAAFGLITLAFVVVTSHSHGTSIVDQRIEQYYDPPENTADEAIKKLLVGDNDWSNAIALHSLLEDIYGDAGATVQTTGITQATPGGQLLNVAFASVLDSSTQQPLPQGRIMECVGCVITAMDGPAAGQSSRIVGLTASPAFQVVLPEGVLLADFTQTANFLINGGQFAGAGAGYNPTSGQLDFALAVPVQSSGQVETWPMALLPRPFSSELDHSSLSSLPQNGNLSSYKPSANEDYDAVDYQNMALAMQLADGRVIIPSFHRQDLCLYWANRPQYSGQWANIPNELKRKIMLRPLGRGLGTQNNDDHPNFTGSNPNFNPLWDGVTAGQGQWDVDNDGDGIADSIWLDLGLPARTMPDGRRYKPLVSFLIVDMDGRLNLNAHGAIAHLATGATSFYSVVDPNNGYFVTNPPQPAPGGYAFAGGAGASPLLPRGFGYGPAEVNLGFLWGNPATDANVASLYQGLLTLRYGVNETPPNPGSPAASPDDVLHANKWWDYGGDYWAFTPIGGRLYGSPPNRLGDGAIGIDAAGQPIFSRMGRAAVGNHEKLNDPYKMDPSKPTLVDARFTVSELERALRPFDRDAKNIRSRLAEIQAPLTAPLVPVDRRGAVTTDSSSVPCPSYGVPRHYLYDSATGQPTDVLTDAASNANLAAILRGGSMYNLLFARFYYEYRVLKQPPDAAAQALTNAQNAMNSLSADFAAPELWARMRMDVNRPFGNGLDENGNGAADDPNELPAAELFTQLDAQGNPVNVPFNHTNTSGNAGMSLPGLRARQQFAKQLYLLALTVWDVKQLDEANMRRLNMSADPAKAHALTLRQIAQWAINVVDFRDRDSIMTPFEYDPAPFGTGGVAQWRPDGDPSTTNDNGLSTPHLVWGCERPELILSETLAFHDRRTEDLAFSQNQKTTDQNTTDTTFDQRKQPEGSLFFEIKNPWNWQQPRPGELCDPAGPAGGIDLARRTPGNHPIWRVTIVYENDAGDQWYRDPDAELPADRPDMANPHGRSVYFTDPSALETSYPTAADRQDGSVRFFPAGAVLPVLPGSYVVVGPGNPGAGPNATTTYFGRDTADNPDPRSDPSDTNGRQIRLTGFSGGSPFMKNQNKAGTPAGWEPVNAKVRTVNTIVIDRAKIGSAQPPLDARLNISEPEPGGADAYPAPTYDPGVQGSYYPTPYDMPFDYEPRGRTMKIQNAVKCNGMHDDGVRVAVIHLQRLADPTQDFNKDTNPYRTIDSMPVDLFAFNGWENDSAQPNLTVGKPRYCSRQRGEIRNADASAPAERNNLWLSWMGKIDNAAPDPTPGPAGLPVDDSETTRVFQHIVRHSLGYLNMPFWPQNWTTANPPPDFCRTTEPNLGEPLLPGAQYAFPWLTWNNRPFTGPMELMLVPAAKSSHLLSTGPQVDNANAPLAAANLLDVFLVAPANNVTPYDKVNHPFSHVPNFFHARPPAGQTDPPPAHRYRLFDFLGVPSPFVGTEIQGNPARFANTTPPYAHGFYPPFNRIPNYREPGKINPNTVFDNRVHAGLYNNLNSVLGLANPAAAATALARSRQGYDVPNTQLDAPQMNGNYPSCFANPFRSAAAARLQPPGVTVPTLNGPNGADINATLLRQSPDDPNQALFQFVSADPSCDTDRNAFFRYQGLQRLQNSVTTQSNVYAVWVTVGYFEVSPWTVNNTPTVDAAHPDGLQLGAELGLDSGEVKRHRAFYIIDRTIPVGFQRGQNLNADKTILLKRYIE